MKGKQIMIEKSEINVVPLPTEEVTAQIQKNWQKSTAV